MKTCFKCRETKSLSDFYKHPYMADGYLNKCKACARADVHAHRHGKGRAAVLEYDRRRAADPERRTASNACVAAYKREYPERCRARQRLGYAVAIGNVIPWPTCAVPECSEKPEGHHYDYSKPLDVIWLCSAHHKQAHAIK